MAWDDFVGCCVGLGQHLLSVALARDGFVERCVADNLDSMKKSTIIGGNKYYLDYEHGCSTTVLKDCCWRNG